MKNKRSYWFLQFMFILLCVIWTTCCFAETLSSEEIKSVQESLKRRGHDVGPINGILDSQTKLAIKAFQQYYQLPHQTGELDDDTLINLGLPLLSSFTPERKVETEEEELLHKARASAEGWAVGRLLLTVSIGFLLAFVATAFTGRRGGLVVSSIVMISFILLAGAFFLTELLSPESNLLPSLIVAIPVIVLCLASCC